MKRGGNGSGPRLVGGPGPSPDEVARLEQEAQQQVVGMLAGLVAGLSSKVTTPQSVAEPALLALGQQEGLGRVLDDAVTPATREAHPEWGVKVRDRQTGEVGVLRIPKDFGACTTLEQRLHHATVLALATNPTPRVLLAAHGIELEFFQAGSSSPKIVPV